MKVDEEEINEILDKIKEWQIKNEEREKEYKLELSRDYDISLEKETENQKLERIWEELKKNSKIHPYESSSLWDPLVMIIKWLRKALKEKKEIKGYMKILEHIRVKLEKESDREIIGLWTKEEEKFLIDNYKTMTDEDVGKKLGKKYGAVQQKRTRLRLKKPKMRGRQRVK